MRISLRGIFLTSERPAATADFYERVAQLPLEKVGKEGEYAYWRIDDGGVQLAIHDAALFSAHTHPAEARSNLTHVYFKIDDREAFLRHLQALAIEPYALDDVVVTIVDPDGRKVMFGTA